MGDKTAIEWTDATWNPIIGCSRVGPGCDHCYAIGVVHREMSPQHVGLTIKRPGERTDWTGEVRPAPQVLDKPLHWRRSRRIFVNSLSDLFHPDLPDEEIAKVFAVMALAPQHTFQVLTKRPQRMATLLASDTFRILVSLKIEARIGDAAYEYENAVDWPLRNVWLGTSIESDRYTFRADHLRATPAAVRWVSAEPLLGPLPSLDLTGIDWIVVGGESGPGARPMHPDWARGLRDRCAGCPVCGTPMGEWAQRQGEVGVCLQGHRAGPAFLFKQWGDWAPDPTYGITYSLYDEAEVGTLLPFIDSGVGRIRRVDAGQAKWFAAVTDTGHSKRITRLGKKAAGRELDGRTWDEYPA